MSMQDPISDMLTRMRNAIGAQQQSVRIPFSKVKVNILETLKREGFIKALEVVEDNNKKDILVYLKYADSSASVLSSIKRISKPSCRVYKSKDEIKPVLNGIGAAVITTHQGVLSDRECRAKQIGGEIICEVY
ncbi:MAG: 30S ribosomal protein S8 [Planctomycetes bacterium]|nr:30S ribosomal protein S8 [Planctomycetota bacterium]